MSEKNGSTKIPEFLREPLEAAQERLLEFEEEAQKVLKELIEKGRESRKDVALLVQRLSKQDWNMAELRGRVGKIREQGRERAQELRGKAESFRAEAMVKLEELQSKAVEFMGAATREQVEELSREIEKIARRLDKADRADAAKGARKTAKRGSAEG